MQKLKVLWKASSWCAVDLAVGLAAGGGHRLVHRRVVGQDEVLQAARQDLDALEADPRTRGFERVAGAAPFAERFGQDLGHRSPGYARTRVRARAPLERGESIAHGFSAPPDRGYLRADAADGHGDRTARARASGPDATPLLDSATDHAAPGRHRAVLRTPLRAPVGTALPDARPAGPAPASDRARDGDRAPARRATGRSSRTASSSISTPTTWPAFGEVTDDARRRSWPTRRSSFARAHHYTLADRPRVDLVADPDRASAPTSGSMRGSPTAPSRRPADRPPSGPARRLGRRRRRGPRRPDGDDGLHRPAADDAARAACA